MHNIQAHVDNLPGREYYQYSLINNIHEKYETITYHKKHILTYDVTNFNTIVASGDRFSPNHGSNVVDAVLWIIAAFLSVNL